MNQEINLVGDMPVIFQLPSGDKLSVHVTEQGSLKINCIENRGNICVLSDSSNSVRLVTAYLPEELGMKRLDLRNAPTRKN